MFQIGFWELALVFFISLWAIGPERLPLVLKILFRWLEKIKRKYQVLKNEIEKEFQSSADIEK
jgi:sec-independent protein translocase protein TatB